MVATEFVTLGAAFTETEAFLILQTVSRVAWASKSGKQRELFSHFCSVVILAVGR